MRGSLWSVFCLLVLVAPPFGCAEEPSAMGDGSAAQKDGARDVLSDGPARDRSMGDITQSHDAAADSGPSRAMTLGTNFWDIFWGNGVKDYFKDGVDFSTTTNPWKQQFLDELAPYGALRFMDWNRTNGSPAKDWSQRTKKTASSQRPVAYEWMVDLCNRTQSDMWITLPHLTKATYWKQLAQLLKAQLDPSLKVYLEYSNETWNGGFQQNGYCKTQGAALKLPGTNDTQRGWAYHVYAAVRLFEEFEAVFGKGSPRLIKVISGQAAWTGPCEYHLRMLNNPTVNPNKTMPNAYAIAPYFGFKSSQNGDLKDAVAQAIGNAQKHRACVKNSGLSLIAYEGGQHITTNADVVSRDPAMYQLYTDYLRGMSQQIQGVFMHYNHVAKFSTGGAWGAMEFTGQPLAQAHKYRALVDWAKSQSP